MVKFSTLKSDVHDFVSVFVRTRYNEDISWPNHHTQQLFVRFNGPSFCEAVVLQKAQRRLGPVAYLTPRARTLMYHASNGIVLAAILADDKAQELACLSATNMDQTVLETDLEKMIEALAKSEPVPARGEHVERRPGMAAWRQALDLAVVGERALNRGRGVVLVLAKKGHRVLCVHAVEVGRELVCVAPRRHPVVREQQPRVHEEAEVRPARDIVGGVHASVCALSPRGGDVRSEMAACRESCEADS